MSWANFWRKGRGTPNLQVDEAVETPSLKRIKGRDPNPQKDKRETLALEETESGSPAFGTTEEENLSPREEREEITTILEN